MITFFRAISFLEGISYLLILSITLGLISRDFVFHLGMAHGVLFMLYLVLSLMVSNSQKWSVLAWLGLLIAAFVPFAFIPVEIELRKAQDKEEAGEAAA